MGNTESAQEGSLSRRSSHRKSGSPSPPAEKRSNSLRRQQNGFVRGADAQLIRRSKTCRVKDRTQRRPICMVTGLSSHQKSILAKRWSKMDNAGLYEMGRRVFDRLFKEDPTFLLYIGLQPTEAWRKNIAFKIHAQRFVAAVCESLRRMRDPQVACDVLRDFGAGYAEHKVAPVFFEKLANALCAAAQDLDEAIVEDQERSPSADPSSSSGPDSTVCSTISEHEQFACRPRQNSTLSTTSSTTLDIHFVGESRAKALTTRHSDSNMTSMARMHMTSANTPPPSLCNSPARPPPAEVCQAAREEAWAVFSAFVANQVQLGYELEKVLQFEMAKLGLNNVPSASAFPTQPIDVE